MLRNHQTSMAIAVSLLLAQGVGIGLNAGVVERTSEEPMTLGANSHETEALLTDGELVPGPGKSLYQFTGLPDGIGAMAWDDDVVRIFVNHEFGAAQGTSWALANGTVFAAGARLSYFDLDRPTRSVCGGGLAIATIFDWMGREITTENQGEFGVLRRFCSSSLYGQAEGFEDDICSSRFGSPDAPRDWSSQPKPRP